MSDELNQKIQQLTELLSDVKDPDRLSGLLSLLSKATENSKPEQTSIENPIDGKKTEQESTDMMIRMRKLLDSTKGQNDPRMDLLNSLKPFLRDHRKKNLHNCLKLLKLTGMTKLLDEMEAKM